MFKDTLSTILSKLVPAHKNKNKTLLVAQYVLDKVKTTSRPSVTPMKLMKLVYIAHGYMLGQHGKPLLEENIMAWEHGPSIKHLYRNVRKYRSQPVDKLIDADFNLLTADEKQTIDLVIDIYNKHSAVDLSKAMHGVGTPWNTTWYITESNQPISNDLIEYFYKDVVKSKIIQSL
jgi:uncharacterized phage-associated protein